MGSNLATLRGNSKLPKMGKERGPGGGFGESFFVLYINLMSRAGKEIKARMTNQFSIIQCGNLEDR